jgi:hypothetical protein
VSAACEMIRRMKLAPIHPLAPSTGPVAHRAIADVTAATAPVPRVAGPVAAPSTAAALEAILDGVARLSTPLVDFPGIATGDMFDIVKGSKVGFLGVRGEAQVLRLDDDYASFKVRAGALGIKVDVVVDVERTGPETVRISSRGSGIPNTTADGRIIESRTNYAEFERTDDPSERTVIQHDGRGRIVIDTVVPTFGDAHLILQKR